MRDPHDRKDILVSSHTRKWPQILLGAYSMVLLTATHWPKPPRIYVPGKDKTLHVVAYAILTGLLLNVLARGTWLARGVKIAAAAVAIVAVAGALDEWTQPHFGRTCDFFDWLADMAGAIGVSIAYLLARARRQGSQMGRRITLP
jgi:VanZ family protein